jgi:CheY-like chemotaxis protein
VLGTDKGFRKGDAFNTLLCLQQDVNMPTMDGLMATRHIRSIEAASTAQSTSGRDTCASSSSASTTEQCTATMCAPQRRVPIVGVSASSSADQLKSAALQGLDLDLATGKSS